MFVLLFNNKVLPDSRHSYMKRGLKYCTFVCNFYPI
nr:MAG TPA: hypothetical protein [Caudoviricetes sp.]